MKIGIIGSGEVGQALAAGFLAEGHSVLLGTRNPSKEEVVKWLSMHPGAQAGIFSAAAQFGEIVVLRYRDLLPRRLSCWQGLNILRGKS